MYLTNKYTQWYQAIVAKSSLRVNNVGYVEKHHILPKSLGGTNDPSNIIKLTPKEHYICHLLLTKMVDGNNRHKMWYAHYMMMRGAKRYKPTSRMYALAKENLSKANKARPGPNRGKKMSEAQKEKISKSLSGKNLGPMSEEHKNKLRKPKSEEHKRKLSESRKDKSFGYTHSEETKKKMSEAQKGKKGIEKTEAQKAHQSNIMTGRKQSLEHKTKRAQSRVGKPLSEETKKKISEALRAKLVK